MQLVDASLLVVGVHAASRWCNGCTSGFGVVFHRANWYLIAARKRYRLTAFCSRSSVIWSTMDNGRLSTPSRKQGRDKTLTRLYSVRSFCFSTKRSIAKAQNRKFDYNIGPRANFKESNTILSFYKYLIVGKYFLFLDFVSELLTVKDSRHFFQRQRHLPRHRYRQETSQDI